MMWYYLLKVLLSAVLIVIITEMSKKSTLLGSVFASVPLISVIAILWLYIDTKDTNQIAALSKDIFWLVLPSLSFFILLPILLKYQVQFYLALILSLAAMILLYLGVIYLMKWLR